MSSALFGILQLDRGEPLGYANFAGLVQSWLQDAGGFAALGLLVYLLYTLSVPTHRSQSERLRVPVSRWMVVMAGLAVACYAGVFALDRLQASGRTVLLGRPIAPPPIPPAPPGMPLIVPPPVWHGEWRSLLLMLGGLLALLGIGEPFARDLLKIGRRNVRSAAPRGGRPLGSYVRRAVVAVAGTVAVVAALAAVVMGAQGNRPVLDLDLTHTLFGGPLDLPAVALAAFAVFAVAGVWEYAREGPIWAVAKLSFKEAVRSKLVWVFVIIFLPALFPVTWFVPTKPADELRATVATVSLVLMFLVLFPAVLLASFYGIPNDIKNQTIHTVVTKPVERFEIVLGRFLGYAALMTVVLAGLTGISLVLMNAMKLDPKAEEETAKARVPLRGRIEFKSRRADFDGTNVGREFDYRKYIAGHEMSPQRAIWHFDQIPAALGNVPADQGVPVEYTFDIFKLTKGEENKGVLVRFRFVTHACPQRPPGPNDPPGDWQWVDKAKQAEYDRDVQKFKAERRDPIGARPGTEGWGPANELAKKYGIFEYGGKEVFDYAVGGIEVPPALFAAAREGDPGTETGPDGKPRPKPRLSVYVKCESAGQLLGAAEPDLYILAGNQRFTVNFVKGVIGLWCRLCILIGLAVACSTYLSGVLSLIVALFVYLCGYATELLNDVAYGRSVGGGPAESAFRLTQAEMATTPLPDSAGSALLKGLDSINAWIVRRFQNVIPDVESFTWTNFVSEGFNVNAEYLVVNLLITLGYLLPWGVLAYYLMKSREVAS